MARLADIKGERSLEVVAELVEPVVNIANDVEAAELFGRKALPKGMTVKEFVLGRLRKSLPKLLKNHRNDVVAICSTIEGVSKEEYLENLTPEKVIIDMAELISDGVFNAFFNSAQTEDNT